MLSQKMIDRLNKQINLEFFSSNLYLQMSAWADNQGLEGCALFLKEHASEEMEHMQKLFDYVLQTGAVPKLGALEAPETDYKSIEVIFKQTLEHEKFITSEINNLVAAAFEEKDYSTFQFLQWYVAEQHEEEALFQSILDKINLLGLDTKNIFFLDREVGRIAAMSS